MARLFVCVPICYVYPSNCFCLLVRLADCLSNCSCACTFKCSSRAPSPSLYLSLPDLSRFRSPRISLAPSLRLAASLSFSPPLPHALVSVIPLLSRMTRSCLSCIRSPSLSQSLSPSLPSILVSLCLVLSLPPPFSPCLPLQTSPCSSPGVCLSSAVRLYGHVSECVLALAFPSLCSTLSHLPLAPSLYPNASPNVRMCWSLCVHACACDIPKFSNHCPCFWQSAYSAIRGIRNYVELAVC